MVKSPPARLPRRGSVFTHLLHHAVAAWAVAADNRDRSLARLIRDGTTGTHVDAVLPGRTAPSRAPEVRVVEVERPGTQDVGDPGHVPSLRSGSIWKTPPCAQSLAWSFIDRPLPSREISRFSSLISTVAGPLSTSPRWSGTFEANATIRCPPVMSSGFGAPVKA